MSDCFLRTAHTSVMSDCFLRTRVYGVLFHGDPARLHCFWRYPRDKTLATTKWDCYDPQEICDNYRYIASDGLYGSDRYQCLGHSLLYHGDRNRDHCFWVYPPGAYLPNCWDCHEPHELCDNYRFVLQLPHADQYQCLGHS
eukprot:TRINITY_DN981_c0_g1_i1.p1 TRINITY_DN981_c0_g1~~TRINITY_DN981_c0_g1_i1.p1  ORF type:complete len:155 (+),score=22.56 TRINITY_DN981_c0_g1_i1:43-465(+)